MSSAAKKAVTKASAVPAIQRPRIPCPKPNLSTLSLIPEYELIPTNPIYTRYFAKGTRANGILPGHIFLPQGHLRRTFRTRTFIERFVSERMVCGDPFLFWEHEARADGMDVHCAWVHTFQYDKDVTYGSKLTLLKEHERKRAARLKAYLEKYVNRTYDALYGPVKDLPATAKASIEDSIVTIKQDPAEFQEDIVDPLA